METNIRVGLKVISYAIIAAMLMTVVSFEGAFASTDNGETLQKTETKAATKISAPGKVEAECDSKANDVVVTWKKVSNAVSYKIYRSTGKKLPKKAYKQVEGTKFSNKNLKGPYTYRYWISAVAKDGTESNVSKVATVKVKQYLTCKIRTLSWYAKLRKKVSLIGIPVKKGTKVQVTKHSKVIPFFDPSRVYIIYKKKGKKVAAGWVSMRAVKKVYGVVSYSKKAKKAIDWPVKKKEAYVNKKKYSSKTKYLVWTSMYTQRVNIFKGKKGKWKLIKSFRCTTGKYGKPTRKSTKTTLRGHQLKRSRVNTRTGLRYYYTHLTLFNKGDAFHSESWRIPDGKKVKNVKKNAQPNTLGCIRLTTKNAKYIYYNLPLGTKAIMY